MPLTIGTLQPGKLWQELRCFATGQSSNKGRTVSPFLKGSLLIQMIKLVLVFMMNFENYKRMFYVETLMRCLDD